MRAWVSLLLLMALGCLPRVGDPFDGGVEPQMDAGAALADGGAASADADAGAVLADGGAPMTDAGVAVADAGSPVSCADGVMNGFETDVDCGGSCDPCASGLRCGSPVDCETGVCTSGRCVAPAQSCGSYAQCVTFVDLTADTASRVVAFPSGGQERYSPKCIKIRFGQSVTFSGQFSAHPFEPACQPAAGPLSQVSNGSTKTFVFDVALGTYGYFCNQHGSVNGSGMAGAIWVVR